MSLHTPDSTTGRRTAQAAGVPLILLAGWALLAATGRLPDYILPAPWTCARTLCGFITGVGWDSPHAGRFWAYAAPSVGRVALGFALAAGLGILGGALCGRWPAFNRVCDPSIQMVRAVPGIAWLPLALLRFGIGTATTVFLIALAAFFPVYVNTLHGVRAIPVEWLRAARIMGASPGQIFLRVVLPGAFPSIQSGLRVAAGVAWAYVVLGELTGVDRGLGAMIMDARMLGDTTAILVGMVCVAALGRLTDGLIVAAARRIRERRR